MFATSLSLGLALLPFVSAAVHDIQVGAGGKLVYSPEAISAQPGDQVVFHFNPKNHTVTQSSFADPCGPKPGGISSGFQPVAANQTSNLPTYTITVNDTQPIWVYCAQAARTPSSHCGQGMVFAINCGLDGAPNSFTNFKNAALAVGASLSAAAAAPSTTAAYASLEGQVHKVIVGGTGTLAFNPPMVSAAPRDVIVFEFHQKNHTVAQSSFDDPCRKLSTGNGFDSGFFPVADNATNFPTWNFTVTDTAPIWAYCRQSNPSSHCGAGMVFAVNSDESSGRNFAAFQNVAKALNGTAVAATVPSATSQASGALSMRTGGASAMVLVASFIAAFL